MLKIKADNNIERAAHPEDVGVSSKQLGCFIDDTKVSDIEVHSIMVIRHNKVAFETWHEPYSANLPHTMYSVSKSFTSTAIGFAIDEGLLSLDTRLVDIFPDFTSKEPSEDLEKITVFHLLTMTAGKDVSLVSDKTKNQWIQDFFDAKQIAAPGEQWRYISENSFMLCAIIHRVTGMSVVDYLMPRLFEPLGVKDRPFWESDGNGVEAGGWGLFITTETLAKFMMCYLNDGKYNGKQIIPENWAHEAVKGQVVNDQYVGADSSSGYGYCFWRNGIENSYRADGMFSQFGVVFEDYDAIVVVTCSEINEQKVRDCIWRHFPDAFIEENSEPYPDEDFTNRHLKYEPLPELAQSPRSLETEKRLEGRIIKMNKPPILDEVGFPLSIMPLPVFYMSADKAGNIDYIRFRFGENTCKFSWTEGDERNTVLCGMDGKARRCRITLGGINFSVACSAAWENTNTLNLWIRPLESICQRRLTFVFNGNQVKMRPRSCPDMVNMANHLASSTDEWFDNPILIKASAAAMQRLHLIIEPTHHGIIR